MKLLPNPLWKQTNRSDVLGTLASSFNLDLTSNYGKTRIAPRTLITTDDITDLGVPIGFERFNSGSAYFYTVAGGYVFRASNTPNSVFSKDTTSGAPSNVCSSDTSDIKSFHGKLYVTADTDIYYNSGAGVWNDFAGNALTGGTVHMMCAYSTRLYITENLKKIWSVANTADTTLVTSGSNTLNLGVSGVWGDATSTNTNFFLTSIVSASDRIWILTSNQGNLQGRIAYWDGQTEDVVNGYYNIEAAGALAGVIKDDVLWVVDTNGRLLAFNGGSFVEKARFPVNDRKYLKNSLSSINNRWIHPNGMIVRDNRIQILVNNEYDDNAGTVPDNFPSGVWEYDEDMGLYHKYSLSLTTLSGLTNTDYGQNRVSRVGGLYNAKVTNTASDANGSLLIGAQIYSNQTATKECIFTDDTNDTVQKAGYFITTKIPSPNIEDEWQKLYVRFNKLLDSSDKIIVKYRTNDAPSVLFNGTWVNGTTFTTATEMTVGDEVEILQGTGSGMVAHITAISGTTITVDETFPVTTGTFKARKQSWKKAGSYSRLLENFHNFDINDIGTWIQLKVFAKFSGKSEINDIIIVNKVHRPIQ